MRLCQRVIDTENGRSRCPLEATWSGSLHVGRAIYLAESCDRHKSGLVDAEPLDGNWERSMVQPPRQAHPSNRS